MRNLKTQVLAPVLLLTMSLSAQTVIKIPFPQPKPFSVSPEIVNVGLPETGGLKLGLEAAATGGSGTYTYKWTLGETILGTEPTLNIDKKGNYILLISDGKGCQSGILYNVTEGTSALNQTQEGSMLVYPNPSKGPVYIQLKKTESPDKIEIFTPDGLKVAEFMNKNLTREGDRIFLDLKHLPKGSYLISIHIDTKILTNAILLK